MKHYEQICEMLIETDHNHFYIGLLTITSMATMRNTEVI